MAEVLEMSSGQKHKYRLVYFDIKGRGEPIRLMFTFFGVHFQDERIKEEDWPNKKKFTPMCQLPYLEVDSGRLVLCQTATIMRYLAKSFRPEDKMQVGFNEELDTLKLYRISPSPPSHTMLPLE